MPARCGSELVLDVRFVTKAAHPQLRGFVDAAFANGFGRAAALQLVRVVELPAPHELHDVPPIARAKWRSDLVVLEALELIFELGEGARVDPVEIAAVR